MSVSTVHRVQRRASESLGLDLEMFLSHCMGAGNLPPEEQPVLLTTDPTLQPNF